MTETIQKLEDVRASLTSLALGVATASDELARIIAALTPQETIDIPLYSQRDPEWSSMHLGHGSTTIGRYGCVITCLAMAAQHARPDEYWTPYDVNHAMKNTPGAFVGANGNLTVFAEVRNALPLEYLGLYVSRYRSAPIDIINQHLEQGHYILTEVDFTPGGDVDQHWVLMAGQADADTYFINDPWTGKQHEFPPAYCRAGWDAARAIFRVVYYKAKPL